MANNNPRCPYKGCKGITKESVKHGKQKDGAQRFRCKGCGRTFTRSRGTIYANLVAPKVQVNLAVVWTGKGFSLPLTAQILDVEVDTVKRWLRKFGKRYGGYQSDLKEKAEAFGLSHEEVERILAYAGLGTKEQRRGAIAYSRKLRVEIQEGYTPPLASIKRLSAEDANNLRMRYARALSKIRGEAHKDSSLIAEST